MVSDDEVMRGRKGRETKENGKFKRDRTRYVTAFFNFLKYVF